MTQRTFSALSILSLLLGAAFALPSVGSAESGSVSKINYTMPGAFPLPQASETAVAPVRILVTDDRIAPRLLRVSTGQRVAWNSVGRDLTRIVFEREVAKSMVCHSLVNFHLHDDQLRSALMGPGDTASFCELAPGTYRYRVEREGASDQSTTGSRQMSARLEGVIVVR